MQRNYEKGLYLTMAIGKLLEGKREKKGQINNKTRKSRRKNKTDALLPVENGHPNNLI